jgi:hypothetical protein
MEEKAKRQGPPRKYPDIIYTLAYDLYKVQRMTAVNTAAAINAKEICDRIDSTQVPILAKIGRKDAEAANP